MTIYSTVKAIHRGEASRHRHHQERERENKGKMFTRGSMTFRSVSIEETGDRQTSASSIGLTAKKLAHLQDLDSGSALKKNVAVCPVMTSNRSSTSRQQPTFGRRGAGCTEFLGSTDGSLTLFSLSLSLSVLTHSSRAVF